VTNRLRLTLLRAGRSLHTASVFLDPIGNQASIATAESTILATTAPEYYQPARSGGRAHASRRGRYSHPPQTNLK